MRKLITLITLSVMLFTFTACVANHSGVPSNSTSSTQTGTTGSTSATTQTGTTGSTSATIPPDVNSPGTLPEVSSIPVADQSQVGQEVSVLLSTEQAATPFYYNCNGSEERLAIVLSNQEDHYPLLILFETDLGGADALYNKIAQEEPFQATVLAMVNISFVEGCVYAYNVCAYSYSIPDSEMFPFDGTSVPAATGEYIGIVGTDHDGTVLKIFKGSPTKSASEELTGDIAVFWRIFERFGLTDLLI